MVVKTSPDIYACLKLNRRSFKIDALFESADRAYIVRLQNGEVAAFDALYWKYHRTIYMNILRLVKDTSATEDILQEVFIALWENRAGIKGDQNVAGWLFTVSYNKSVSWLKKSLRQSLMRSLLAVELYPNDQEQPQQKDSQLQKLDAALQQLSPRQQEVIELCKFQGKTYEEAALELHISKHTVKEYLSMAMASLKKYLSASFIPFIIAFSAPF